MSRLNLSIPLWLFIFTAAVVSSASQLFANQIPAVRVVVIVCDGLRPDSVTPQDMPTLYALSQRGCFFYRHHPVYLSSTEVNGTALATGAYPFHSGIIANNEYRPDVELLRPFGTEEPQAVGKADSLSNGRYLRMPTVAEIVRRAGLRTVIAGTKGVALLLDRSAGNNTKPATQPALLYAGQSVPEFSSAPANPTFPAVADATHSPNRDQDTWTTSILIDKLWAGDIPAFTTLWLSEPDFAQHGSGPGSPVARAALKSDDDNIARVLNALDAAGVRDSTDILVVSDHGFSTIERTIDVAQTLTAAGFDATLKFSTTPHDGQILVVPNGGSFSLYVIGHPQPTIARLVRVLQGSDFAGTIFTREPLDGTFTLAQAALSSPDGPDILVSMRWNDRCSATGMPGMLDSTATKFHPGQGYHASLSRFDMHNTLIASGPDFKTNFTDQLPTGNIDIAPTVLALLNLSQPTAMDGRVLTEAFAHSSSALQQPISELLETTIEQGQSRWHQYLHITRIGTTTYFDEGNGGAAPAAHSDPVAQSHLRDWKAFPAIAQLHTDQDIFALGDVHGDFSALARVLAGAHLVDSAAVTPAQIRWTGGRSILVCTGDIIDKWDHSLDVIAAFRSLAAQASKAGGRVIVTMGNHEAEFLAGDKKKSTKKADPAGALLLDELRAAGINADDIRAGIDDQGIGAFLRNLPFAAEVNDIFFCHAGNTHAQTLAQLDCDLQSQIDQQGFGAPILSDSDSMLEARMHPTPWWEADAGKSATGQAYLRTSVTALGAHHLVFGHQPGKIEFDDHTTRPKDTPFTKFHGLVFMIDTGMSRGADSGPPAILRFHRDGASQTTATALYSNGDAKTLWSEENGSN